MKAAEHNPKAPAVTAGLPFARSTALSRRLLALLLGATALLALLPSLASADGRIGTSGFPAGLAPGGIFRPGAVAVSHKEGGDLYLLDVSISQRVDQFQPDGTFVRAFGWGVVPGAAAGTGDLTAGSTFVSNITTTLGAFGNGPATYGRAISGEGIPPGTTITEVTATNVVLSKPASETRAHDSLTVTAGPGNVPTNERQKLTVTAASGEFKLAFRSLNPGSSTETTAALPAAATHEQLQAALEALANIGSANVSVSGGPGDVAGSSPYLIEFKGRYADTNVHQLSATDLGLSGGSPSSGASITTVQEGAEALETCTTVCVGVTTEEGDENYTSGSLPGQLSDSDEIAVDNDPASSSYGDLYVLNQNNFRIDKYSPSGEFLLMFGGEVDKTTHADVCTAADLASGDTCGEGVPGTGPAHFYREEPQTQAGHFKSWATESNNSIAVGPGGTVYVGDYGRIQEFEEDGNFAGELSLAEAEPRFVTALAIDSTGNVYERSAIYGNVGGETGQIRSQIPGVREYGPGPTHSFLRTFDAGPEEAGSEPTHLALDSAGDLFVSDLNGDAAQPTRGDFEFRAFKPDGSLYAEFGSDQLRNFSGASSGTALPRGIAIGDAAGKLYAPTTQTLKREIEQTDESYVAVIPQPAPGPPIVTEQSVTDIEPPTATLHAHVNPAEHPTEYHFEYTTTDFSDCGALANPACHTTPSTAVGSLFHVYPVSAPLSALTPATLYHYRAVAESSAGTVPGPTESFETLPPVSVRDFTTQTVAPELVEFKAELDNNNSLQTGHYTICIGPEEGHYTECSEGILPAHSSEFKAVRVTFTGLHPNTPYHYQLTAENEYTSPGHPFKTADATFTTEESAAEGRAAEDCPANGSVHGAPGGSTLREENNSLALPDCRAYEQVTPVDKHGGEAILSLTLAPSGERLQYFANGAFAGASADEISSEYIAHRTPEGWASQPSLGRPGPTGTEPLTFSLYSPELDRWVFASVPGFSAAQAAFTLTGTLSMGFADGSYVFGATPTVTLAEGEPRSYFFFLNSFAAAADDLSRLFIFTSSRELASDPRPDDSDTSGTEGTRIYEASGVGGPDPLLRLVAEVPDGLHADPYASNVGGCFLNTVRGASSLSFTSVSSHAIRFASADGSTLFYTAPIEEVEGAHCGPGTPNPVALFAHHEGEPVSAAVQLNLSQCISPAPCAAAPPATPIYQGASPDGRRAWFTTAQPLLETDGDQTDDLYLARLNESGQLEELVQASHGEASDPHPGQGAGVQGVVDLSADATHVSFVATGVLTTEPNSAGASAQQGADNLYLYDSEATGTEPRLRFVANLCSEPESSGAVADSRCPADLQSGSSLDQRNDQPLWSLSSPPAQSTPDGRYLLFTSWGRLTPDDTDNVADLYRYDFQTGHLARLSFGRRGNDADGNDSAFPATTPESTILGAIGAKRAYPNAVAGDYTRAISADGSLVIFATAAPLVSHDTNTGAQPGCFGGETGCDIYQWQEFGHGDCREAGGCISLVSNGTDPHGSNQAVIGSSGRDIAFGTSAGLAPADTDGVSDYYDARENGGFPYTPPPIPCGGNEICHHEPPPPPSAPKITSEGETGGNGTQQLKCAKGKVRVKKHGQVRCVKRHSKPHKHKKRSHKRANARQTNTTGRTGR